jgi:gliding motility-associated-like protein
MRFSLSFIFWAFAVSAWGQVSDKLVARFPFKDCKVFDESGNGSSGAFLVKGDTLCRCGVQDEALGFDGDDALLLVGPLNDLFTTSDFTVGFYFKPDATDKGGAQVIMAKQADCTARKAFWVRYAPPANGRPGSISSGIGENDTLGLTVSAPLDRDPCWQYIALVRSNTRYNLYINGTLRDSKATSARLNITSNAPLKIGEAVCPLDRGFMGQLDELRFHNKALNKDEIGVYNLYPDNIQNSDTLIYLGNSFDIRLTNTCAKQFSWEPRAGVSDPFSPTPDIKPEGRTVYYLTFKHDNCLARDSIVVDVVDPDTLDCSRIFIPNAFTPGATVGRNDVFGVSNPFAIDDFISFEVFDRWGGRVFAAETEFDNWDGTFQGKFVNPGIFLYRLRYRCDGTEKVKAGTLTLLR